jgi:hypothetical protein
VCVGSPYNEARGLQTVSGPRLQPSGRASAGEPAAGSGSC